MNQLAQSADDGLEKTIRRVLANYFAQSSAETGNGSEKLSEQEALYHSPEGLALRQEMVWNARKLWERQYVDGNGGQSFVPHRRALCSLHTQHGEQGGRHGGRFVSSGFGQQTVLRPVPPHQRAVAASGNL